MRYRPFIANKTAVMHTGAAAASVTNMLHWLGVKLVLIFRSF